MLLTRRLCASSVRVQRSQRNATIVKVQGWLCHRRNNVSEISLANSTCSFSSLRTVLPQSLNPPSTLENASENPSNLLSDERFATGLSGAEKKTELPVSCPGCGALSQEIAQTEAGYYSRSRKAVKAFLKQRHRAKCSEKTEDDNIDRRASEHERVLVRPETSDGSKITVQSELDERGSTSVSPAEVMQTPVCDRCHDLIYNSKGQSIAHPSVEDIADSIAESPFKRNHVYHVLDAADFPMSLFPKVFDNLELAKPRSQNRRARHKFTTRPSISFIVTRSDLLAPTKEMVDRMLPYFQNVLRSALGRVGRDMRLGNVHLVSAKRGWWTTDIKESIWERGGGNWMVGRVNVGKSNLFEVLFPKGSGDRAPVYAELEEEQRKQRLKLQTDSPYEAFNLSSQQLLAEDSLLPPPQPEVRFPTMPVVSSLPGTTASPIRLPFGGHRGELIDLPGLERGNLENFVQPEHKLDLVMQHRPNVQQLVIKPGQSLLLGGGLIRITPDLDENDPSTTMLAYPFVPIDAHVTSTEKAIGAQLQDRISGVKSILAEGAGTHIASAGMFKLNTDVTKLHAGPLVRAGVSVTKLAFAVYSTDILIEGVGWVELVCQYRKPRTSRYSVRQEDLHQSRKASVSTENSPECNGESLFRPFASQAVDAITVNPAKPDMSFPQVEIFSPHGKHVDHRRPLAAWTVWESGRKHKANASGSTRSRKPMVGSKKQNRAAMKVKATGSDNDS